ncbi:MAG: ribonuclease P protein component [Acidobacteria bacterium]|nr:ribonuclease P protein component [Acidobacteriota bacterium]
MAEARSRFFRQERLQNRRDFLEIYERGDRIHTPHFVLYVLENRLSHHRLGVTVSRKLGKPVRRNRIKRRLREIFRMQKDVLAVPCDLVVNAKRSAGTASFEELSTQFVHALQKWMRKREVL